MGAFGSATVATSGIGAPLAAMTGTASLAYAHEGYTQAFGLFTHQEGNKVLQSYKAPTPSYGQEQGIKLGTEAAMTAATMGVGKAIEGGTQLAKSGYKYVKDKLPSLELNTSVMDVGFKKLLGQSTPELASATAGGGNVAKEIVLEVRASSAKASKEAKVTKAEKTGALREKGVEDTEVSILLNSPVKKTATKYEYFPTQVEWTAPSGTKQTYKVYQRNDIDWDQVRTTGDKRFIGKTNREAALAGKAPQLQDGSVVPLHHIGQDSRGPLVEVSEIVHKKGKRPLHNQFGGDKNFEFPVKHDSKWQSDVGEYWKWRVKDEK